MRIEWWLQRREGTYPSHTANCSTVTHSKASIGTNVERFLEIIMIKTAWTLLLFGCMSDLNFVKLVPLRFLKIYYNYDR